MKYWTMSELRTINIDRWTRIGKCIEDFVGCGKRRDLLPKILTKHHVSMDLFEIGYNEYIGAFDRKYYENF